MADRLTGGKQCVERRSFLALAATSLAATALLPRPALAATDYSFLDNMTESELSALQSEVKNRLDAMRSTPEEQAGDTPAKVSDVEITFRGLPWGTTKAEADIQFDNDGLHRTGYEKHDIYRPSKISYYTVQQAGESVDNSGIQCYFEDVPVAGFTAEATVCYRYPLDNNGYVISSDEDAQLYLARYYWTFDDPLSAYDDIKAKLDSLYGDVSIATDGDWADAKANTWTDEVGNWARLSLYEGYNDYTYSGHVLLVYSASGAERQLDTLEAAVQQEKMDAENAVREANKDETSGL